MEAIREQIQTIMTMDLRDMIDILLVAYLIYRVMLLVRTTASMRIFKGIIAVLVVSALTQILELRTLSFLIGQVLAVGLLAMVVLFQPELRRMMDHLGSTVSLRRFLTPEKVETDADMVISQTVKACEVMGREKVGALIVFARTHRLDEYFKTGTVIDGSVSEQLIRNIFFPKAALHDGAMIIRDGRVAAAGCVMPLSDSHRLSADLGTRHRAGVAPVRPATPWWSSSPRRLAPSLWPWAACSSATWHPRPWSVSCARSFCPGKRPRTNIRS